MRIWKWLFKKNVVVDQETGQTLKDLEADVFRKDDVIISGIRGKNGSITPLGKKMIIEEWEKIRAKMTLTPEEVGLSKVYALIGLKLGVSETTVSKIVRDYYKKTESKLPVKKAENVVRRRRKKAASAKKKKAAVVATKVNNNEHHMKGDYDGMKLLNKLSYQSKLKNKLNGLDKKKDSVVIKETKGKLKVVQKEISELKKNNTTSQLPL